MKKKIICIILAAATVAVASIGAAPSAVSLFQNLRDFKKLQSDLKKEQQQHSDANNKLAGKGSQGAANGNDLDSTIITAAVASDGQAALDSVTAYTVEDGILRKLAVLDNAADVPNLQGNADVLEYAVSTSDTAVYLKGLTGTPIVFDKITVLPLTGQVYTRVSLQNGGNAHD